MKYTTCEEAVALIKSSDKVFIHSVACAPQLLIAAMTARSSELRNVNIYHMHTEGPAPYAEPGMEQSFRSNNFFVGGNVRKAVQEGRADYIPCFLSEIPGFFHKRIIPLDVAMLMVSPPDKNGYVTMGPSVDTSLAAAKTAKIVIAEVNRNLPRTHGDGYLHISEFAAMVEVDYPIYSPPQKPLTDTERKIGGFVAGLIEDGATLQMGIGAIPNAALEAMRGHKALGVHTEMFSDGLIDLVERGVITNQHKTVHPHHIVTGFALGSKKLYDFIDDNPKVRFLDIAYVNNTNVIRKNPKVTAVNSAIEIDLSGQGCADSIGSKIYSGVGGQMDFIRGAAKSPGGKPIIALPSVTKNGESKIVPRLKEGAGVVTTRAHMHYVVTEYGVAYLYGQPLRDRMRQLIAIAHPNHREMLAKSAFEWYKILV
jgi:acyl-CoA hydrolase